VLLYAILLIFSVGFVGYYSYWNIWQLLINNKSSHLRATAKPVIEHWVESHNISPGDTSLSLAGLPDVSSLAYDLTSREAVAVVCDTAGKILANGKRLPEEMEPPPVNRQYFRQALAGRNEVNYFTTVDGERLLVLLIPLRAAPSSDHILGVIQVSTSLTDIYRILYRLASGLLGVIVIILTLGIILGNVLIGYHLRDLRQLDTVCREISTGNFAKRPAITGREDEIGRLAASFNYMLGHLEKLFRSQRRFVANASHELLTPLTGLHGSLEVLLRGGQDDRETLNRLIKGMYREVNHLIRICNHLLDLSHLENISNIRKKEIVLGPFLENIKEKIPAPAETHPVEIKGNTGITILTDPDLLEQILLNLLSNAVRYSPDGTTVIIDISVQDEHLTIQVIDEGEGMDEETLARIFEPFFRGKADRDANTKGTGLGLTLTKAMVEALGGTIRLSSTPGQGTTATVTLPLR